MLHDIISGFWCFTKSQKHRLHFVQFQPIMLPIMFPIMLSIVIRLRNIFTYPIIGAF